MGSQNGTLIDDRHHPSSLMQNVLEPLIKQEHEHIKLNVKGYDVGK